MTDLLLTHALGLLGFALAVVATVHMLAQRRSPQSATAWLVAMFVFPWVGVPLYLAFGGRKMRELMDAKADLELGRAPEPERPTGRSPTAATLCALGIPAPHPGNAFRLHDDGRDAFRALDAALAGADRRIDYATFILADDAVGRAVLERLTAKARAGVEVRLLLDAVGSLPLSRASLAPLAAAGGRIAHFMPVLHRPFRGRTNLRNHRKIVVVDGAEVWTGGRNTAADYLAADEREPPWIDLSCSLRGPACAIYADVFEADWRFAAGARRGPPDGRRPAPAGSGAPRPVGDALVQVVPSGPDTPNDALLAALVGGVYAARTRVWLVTPYFVPPDGLTDALTLAARRGVDVRLVVPARSNHRLADWAREPHLAALVEAGAAVLLHPRMVHAKGAVLDADVGWLGSANLDERSLLLNFEIMTALHGGAALDALADRIDRLAAEGRCWSATGGRARRILESLAKTVAPLL